MTSATTTASEQPHAHQPCVTLRPLRHDDLPQLVAWRNDSGTRPGLRTPFMLTEEQQRAWFDDVVCSRQAPDRYWAVDVDGSLAGQVGLTGIAWENRVAELSLLTDPQRRHSGIGRAAFLALLREGFDRLNLRVIYGECYACNPAITFWEKMVREFRGDAVTLPGLRKYWDGRYWATYAFAFMEHVYREQGDLIGR